ncbi:hypothetical protein WME98_28785 [Sorangium sp. So ce296]|uniref:hypothetical protein n=1 Tax=Sorangium sp. So ce296 TaxID=3133296 RepID=UPI003F5DA290
MNNDGMRVLDSDGRASILVRIFAGLAWLPGVLAGCGAADDGVVEGEAAGAGGESDVASEALVPVPAGYSEVALSAPSSGVRVFKRNDADEWVTIVDLRQATARNITGAVSGGDPDYLLVQRNSYTAYWTDARSHETSTRKLRVVVSGTFGAFTYPTGIAFGLKKDGSHISYGYAAPGGPAPESFNVKLFTFNNPMSRAWIGTYDRSSFGSPDVVGALDVAADKNKYASIQRTMVGVRDDNGDGDLETILVLSTRRATQAVAASRLSAFGAHEMAMLDGSGSTSLIVDGATRIAADRPVPHAIAFYSGK